MSLASRRYLHITNFSSERYQGLREKSRGLFWLLALLSFHKNGFSQRLIKKKPMEKKPFQIPMLFMYTYFIYELIIIFLWLHSNQFIITSIMCCIDDDEYEDGYERGKQFYEAKLYDWPNFVTFRWSSPMTVMSIISYHITLHFITNQCSIKLTAIFLETKHNTIYYIHVIKGSSSFSSHLTRLPRSCFDV